VHRGRPQFRVFFGEVWDAGCISRCVRMVIVPKPA
jgi:hypothetical protein